jgi:hypothetical protein
MYCCHLVSDNDSAEAKASLLRYKVYSAVSASGDLDNLRSAAHNAGINTMLLFMRTLQQLC